MSLVVEQDPTSDGSNSGKSTLHAHQCGARLVCYISVEIKLSDHISLWST